MVGTGCVVALLAARRPADDRRRASLLASARARERAPRSLPRLREDSSKRQRRSPSCGRTTTSRSHSASGEASSSLTASSRSRSTSSPDPPAPASARGDRDRGARRAPGSKRPTRCSPRASRTSLPSAAPAHASPFDDWALQFAAHPLTLVALDGGRVVGYADLELRNAEQRAARQQPDHRAAQPPRTGHRGSAQANADRLGDRARLPPRGHARRTRPTNRCAA